ncbi:Altered inheritance of mitochondria protein 18, mitochondrial [Pseudozyma hubeiensis]|nr:Altered inheritance of mitochondria protein 18, mitochondrial [Pseudozyma hubeiensis]
MISLSTKLAVASASRLAAPRSAGARGVATFTRSYPSFSSSASSQPRAAFFQQSFHPSIAASLASTESSHTGQSRWTTLVAAAVALAGIASAYQLSSPVHLDAAPPAASSLTSITSANPSTQVVVDPDTNLAFPLYIPTPASFSSTQPEPRLRLVGLGVRTVSFLRVRVYVAALYIDETHISSSTSSGETLEAHMKQLLDSGAKTVIRIVPVRNTDFNHLRDGFIRALQARLKKALKRGEVDAEGERKFQEEIQAVKEAFPRGSVPKGKALDCVVVPKEKGSGLRFEYDGQVFGEAQGSGFSVARELVLAYFAEQGEISAPFKKSVEEALFGQKVLPVSA